MRKSMRLSQCAICMIIAGICGYALWVDNDHILSQWGTESLQKIKGHIERMYMPALMYVKEGKKQPNIIEEVVNQAMHLIPMAGYVKDKGEYLAEPEDEVTYEMILSMQAQDENEVGKDGNLVKAEEPAPPPSVSAPEVAASLDMSIERLRDFDYLLNNFYVVDSTTMIGPEQLNPDDLLGRSMKITKQEQAPKVLIFHTHSQEEFVDSTPGDAGTSIVGMGAYLAQVLNEQYHIPSMHHAGVYDLVNGKLDRSSAYELAEAEVRNILAANPSIEVVIDLHRDGVNPDTHLVTEIDGKPTAKIMFFNGLSRTRDLGDIAYLQNPYIQDNLAFSLQMELASRQMYADFTRKIYLRGYRYNLHLMPKSLLVEAGAQTNTVGEMRNAMEALAKVMNHVLAE